MRATMTDLDTPSDDRVEGYAGQQGTCSVVVRAMVFATLFALAAFLELGGHSDRLDAIFWDMNFRLTERPASGEVVVVRIDPASLAGVGVWPWPRSLHAALIDRLDADGADAIALDIDFSSASFPEEDAALAAAVARAAAPVYLPVFTQYVRPTSTSERIGTTPNRAFLGSARLASATMVADPDGLVRRSAIVRDESGVARPTLAAVLAGLDEAQSADPAGREPFFIDYGIDAASIPQVSAIDVLGGDVGAGFFAGRRVIVGPTANELGDVHAVPAWSALPGAMVQALAAESLLGDRALRPVPHAAVLAALALFVGMAALCTCRRWWWLGVASALGGAAVAIVTGYALYRWASLSVPVGTMALTASVTAGLVMALQTLDHARQLARQAHRLEAAVGSMPDGFALFDDTGHLAIVNARMKHLSTTADGVPSPFRVGARYDEVFATAASAGLFDRAAGTKESWPAQRGNRCRPEPCTCEEPLADGRWVAITESRTPQGGMVVVWRDITERVRRAAEVEAARVEAESANLAKSQFIAAMSHELRTPLNAVIGFSEMMREEMLGPIGTAAYRDYAADIHESGTHLLSIINDILDLSRIESGRLELHDEAADVGRLVASALRLARPAAEAAGVLLAQEIEPGLPPVLVDARVVKQILGNLLSNATRFTPRAETVAVRAALRPDGGLRLVVADTGNGIPPDDLERVQQPFEQGSRGLNRCYEGVGLGLTLVRAFAERHGGRFLLESTPGTGTTATVDLPAERTCPQRLAPTARAADTSAAPA